MDRKILILLIAVLLVSGCRVGPNNKETPQDYVGTPYIIDVPAESRSISFENPTGQKGTGGTAASNLGVGRKGAPLKEVGPGQTVTLCDIKGPGVIRRIWMTVYASQENLLGFVIRGYWDNQKHPSIEAPIGGFFGCSHGIPAPYQSAVHSVNSNAGLSIFLPMPFAERAVFTLTNEKAGGQNHIWGNHVYYTIDYTLNDPLPESFGRLHVQYRRENPTTLKNDFEILPKRTGQGRYIGCVLGVHVLEPDWWGEGEVKIYLDGDTDFPTICGTGTEDYIGQSWGLQDATYLYGGTPLQKEKLFTMYRWHIQDPVYWNKDIRVTIQQIGASKERGYFERQDDWSATTFWYEPVPSEPLPTLIQYEQRIADLTAKSREKSRLAKNEPISVGDFQFIYDPSVGEKEKWYINDHCFVRGKDGTWHLFGITNKEPASPGTEFNFAHATATKLTQTPWEKQPYALSVDPARNEKHLWAPHVIMHNGVYYMYYCAGDNDNTKYKIHLATSEDLYTWKRHPQNPMIVDGYDARDPYVLRLPDEWVMYYTATSEPKGGNHVVYCQRSDDLIHWKGRQIVFIDPSTGTWGGPTESPTLVRRGKYYYLFIGPRDNYTTTCVYRSEDPFKWTIDQEVARINSHAVEVIRDVDGKWYVSHCGWGQGGVYLAPLTWHDGVDDSDTSLPIPVVEQK
jgi:hypothetical protein